MIKAQYFQRVKSSILGCKFHLQFRKFSMFMIVSPKILNLHGSMLYYHLENNKDDTSTTGLLLPSQLFLDPLFCTWKTRLSNSFLIVSAHFLKSLQSAPVVFRLKRETNVEYVFEGFDMRTINNISYKNEPHCMYRQKYIVK